MKICYFGDFDPDYSRNRVIISGLQKNGVEVLICNDRTPGLKKYWGLFKEHKKIKGRYEAMIVGYSDSRMIVPFAKLLSEKHIVWDAFYSLYDSWVFDRKLVSPRSLKAFYYWLIEWIACRAADSMITDTNEHIKYFSRTFGVELEKMKRVLVGSDDTIFYPREKKFSNNFIVHFHGNFIPLQGAEYIVRSAGLLKGKGIHFRLIGKGQEYNKVKSLAKELSVDDIIEWIGRVSYEDLAVCLAEADVALGIFGSTPKTAQVIPNKIYEAAAMKKAIITSESPAIKEIFADRKEILLCKPGDPSDLAQKIMELKGNQALREEIAENAYRVFKERATPKVVVEQMIREIGIIK